MLPFYLYAQYDYAAIRPLLAADPRFGKLHEQFDLEHLANRACHDFGLVLALALEGGPHDPETPEALRLGTWLDGRATLQVRAEVQRSSLWLPRGVPNAGLGLDIRIDVQPEA
jgi:hypothetical protein